MDKSRRNLIKAGASAAVGSVLMGSRNASAQDAPGRPAIPAVPPLAAKIGLRLATGSIAGAAPTVLVVLDDGRVVDLKSEALRQGAYLSFDAASMLALVASGNTGFAETKAVLDRAIQQSTLPTLAQVALTSPIPRPQRNIFCVGGNYLDHFEEGKQARGDRVVEKLPDHPVFFSKATHTMNGPFGSIPHDITLSNTRTRFINRREMRSPQPGCWQGVRRVAGLRARSATRPARTQYQRRPGDGLCVRLFGVQ